MIDGSINIKPSYLLHSNNRLIGENLFLFLLADFFLVALGINQQVYSFIFPFSLFIVLGSLIYGVSSISSRLYFSAFFFNIIVAVIFVFYFYSNNNTPFIGGGDDASFYQWVTDAASGRGLPYEVIVSARYALFILFSVWYYKFLNFVGILDNHFIHFILLNCFIGAHIAPLIYKMAKSFFAKKIAFNSGRMMCFFPFTVFFSSVILREIWVATLFLWAIYLFTNKKLPNIYKYPLGISLVLISTLGIRASTGLMALAFIFFYWIFKKYHKDLHLLVVVIGLFFSIQLGAIFMQKFLKRSIAIQYTSFTELAQKQSSSGSLGVRILTSSNPIVRALVYPISLYNPIPPYYSNRLNDLFIGVGAVFWYFMVPVAIWGMLKCPDKALGYASFATLILLLIIISAALGSFRHRLLITPIVVLFYFVGSGIKSPKFSMFKWIHHSALIGAFILYIILKLI